MEDGMNELGRVIKRGDIYITPVITIEPKEYELIPDNGPFEKILSSGTIPKKYETHPIAAISLVPTATEKY
jgi:hypothetical protein